MRKYRVKYDHGDWKAICDVCGWLYKASELKLGIGRQRGLRVCLKDWDEYHPQDDLRAVPDNPQVPWTRPEGVDVFVPDPDCTIEERQAVAGQGVAGCLIAGLDSDLADEEDGNLEIGTFVTNNSTL